MLFPAGAGEAEHLTGDERGAAERLVSVSHYTRCVPSGKSHWFRFESALVVFSIPANCHSSRAVLGREGAVWELTRLWAPDGHRRNLLTAAIAAAVRAFVTVEPACEALVSYADPNAEHHGGIYQAASWTYQGQCEEGRSYRDADGHLHARRKFHSGSRSMNKAEIEAQGYEEVKLPGKHRYAKGLTRRARREVASRSVPTPPKPQHERAGLTMSVEQGELLRNVLSRLEGVKPRADGHNWDALCPAHEDHRQSLSVGVGEDGRILLHCQRGCETAAIVGAVGMTMADLFAGEQKANGQPAIVAVYDYRDEAGCLLYQSVRYFPKDFRQRRPDGKGGWLWNLAGVSRVLYRLPELVNSPAEDPVFVVEGEKDVERLRRLGLVATTNAMGAGKWRSDYNGALRGRKVFVLPDNDAPGKEHAEQVRRSLQGVAASVAVVALPGLAEKGDVSDWIAAGGTKDKLLALIEQAARVATTPAGAEPWDQPIPLEEDGVAAEPFPLDAFPARVAEFFQAAAEAIGCPVDYVGCFGLGILSGSAGASYAVDIKDGYAEPLHLYVCNVAPKGSGKTPALKAIARPVYEEASRRHHEGGTEPAYVSDVTVEKVADLLREGPRGQLVIRDELSGWIRGMDQYKAKGSGSDRQFWLSVNSADPVSVHRKDPDSPPVFIRHPSVAVVGGIQPPVLSRLKGDDDGFFDRILFSYADPLPARGETWRSVPEDLAGGWKEVVLKVLAVPMSLGDYGPCPYFLKLSDTAKEAWQGWTNWVAGQRNDPNFPEWLKGPAIKLTGFAARLAGVVHVVRAACFDCPKRIEGIDMEAGAALARYFLSQARKVYRAMGRDPRISDAQRVLTWIRNWPRSSFSRRDAWRGLRRQFDRPEDLAPPLRLLQSHAFIRWLDPASAGLAKHHTGLYEINPKAAVETTSGDSGDKQ